MQPIEAAKWCALALKILASPLAQDHLLQKNAIFEQLQVEFADSNSADESFIIDGYGRARTLSGWGVTNLEMNPFSYHYVEQAAVCGAHGQWCAEVGAGPFGMPSQRAIKAGAKIVINDIEPVHLLFVWSMLNRDQLQNVIFDPGPFPGTFLQAKPRMQFGVIFSERIIHFLSPRELSAFIVEVRKRLLPGGRWIVVEDGPYLGGEYEHLREEILRRKRHIGTKYPYYFTPERLAELLPRRSRGFPDKPLHLLDLEELTRTFALPRGFERERAHYFPRPDYADDMQLSGGPGESWGAVFRAK